MGFFTEISVNLETYVHDYCKIAQYVYFDLILVRSGQQVRCIPMAALNGSSNTKIYQKWVFWQYVLKLCGIQIEQKIHRTKR